MENIEHRIVNANGLNMHVAELGEGPLVLFIHGFPELWYSWRHQILFMAAHGYRAVAPDLRGYGDTTGVPTDDPSKFTILHVVGDLIALLDAIAKKQEKVFVVGHDWGAITAWHLCLYRPDKVKALVNLSVHYSPRNPNMKPVEMWKRLYGEDHYIFRFQEPGYIESVLAAVSAKTVMKKFLRNRSPDPFYFPKGKAFNDLPDTSSDSPWLTDEDLEYYGRKFEQTGFTGGVNYYRAYDLSWELNAPWTGAEIKVPTKFMVGELDLIYNIAGVKEYIHNGGFKKYVPLLEQVVVLKDTAHFIHQERPDEINKHILAFFQKF